MAIDLQAIKQRNEERRHEARLGFNVSDAVDHVDALIAEVERLTAGCYIRYNGKAAVHEALEVGPVVQIIDHGVVIT